MRTLLLLAALCLTGCVTKLTTNSAPVDPELLQPCGDTIAQPLTTADQYDTSRALVEAAHYGRACAARHDALINAVKGRELIATQIKASIEAQ